MTFVIVPKKMTVTYHDNIDHVTVIVVVAAVFVVVSLFVLFVVIAVWLTGLKAPTYFLTNCCCCCFFFSFIHFIVFVFVVFGGHVVFSFV